MEGDPDYGNLNSQGYAAAPTQRRPTSPRMLFDGSLGIRVSDFVFGMFLRIGVPWIPKVCRIIAF